MDEDFEICVGFATIGSFCIIIATLITDKLQIPGIEEISAGFLIAGFLMVFSISSLLLSAMIDWKFGEEKLCVWSAKIAVIALFISSLFLMINYIRYAFFT